MWPCPSCAPTPQVPFCALRWQFCLYVLRTGAKAGQSREFEWLHRRENKMLFCLKDHNTRGHGSRSWTPEELKVMQVVTTTPTFSWGTLKTAKLQLWKRCIATNQQRLTEPDSSHSAASGKQSKQTKRSLLKCSRCCGTGHQCRHKLVLRFPFVFNNVVPWTEPWCWCSEPLIGAFLGHHESIQPTVKLN